MRKNIEFSIGALLIGCAVAACSGGGGGTSLPVAPPHGTTPAAHQNVAFTITVPAAKTSSVRSPKYVSSSTQSVSIVETDGTAPALPAVVQNTTPGSPNCTTAAGATSCTITVNANVGADSFTVKTYDATNAGGSVLSTGTVTGTVAAGTANSFPLTLGGTVASFALVAGDAYPQVNGSTTITAQAKDADGNTIIGTYDSPIALTSSASGATLSNASFASSSGTSTLTLSASQTASFTVSGSVNGKSGSLTINPSSGIVYYNVGSGSLDVTGFHIITGNDGKLYYTTLGLLTCTNLGFCYGNSGALGQFDPATGKFTEIPLSTDEPVAPYQTADGTVWVSLSSTTVGTTSNVTNGFVGRVSGGFSASNLSTIALPTPAPFDGNSRPRTFTLGADGNLYLTGNTDYNIYKIPVSNPSTSSITAIPLPSYTSPPGSVFPSTRRAQAQGITTGSDGNLYMANFNFWAPSVLQYNPTTSAFTSFAPPGGQGPQPRYIVTGSDGNLYQSYGGACTTAPCYGGLNAMTTAGAFTQIGMPDGYSEPDDLAAGSGFIAFVDLGEMGFGTYDFTSKEVRDYPVDPNEANNFQCCSVETAPDGITVGSDGSLWYITYGTVSSGGPLAIAHVVMTSNWSVWPSQELNLNGTGTANAQLVGIMESGDSGPFTVTSSNSSVATLQPITGESHNFHLVGAGPGNCTVTITDKNGRSESIAVTVTETSGTVSGGRRGAVASKGGLF